MCNSYHLFSYSLKHIMSPLPTMLSKRTIATALFTIAIASTLIVVSGFAGYAFAKKGKGGDSAANTMTNPADSSSKDNPGATSSSDSQSPNTHGGISQKDLKTFFSCVSHDAQSGRLNLADVNDC